ncbi:ABC transporter permease [Eisenbergiella massiliensis]|uniref:ABC transporter permease n=1 Tax=Eisenbergiella massiliensis TaxID=1720294 RepID=UPI003FA4B62E
MKANWMLYLMLAPAVIATILFMYVPIYGVVIAFQDYNPAFGFTGSPWVGFKWFRFVFQMPDFKDIMRNTVVIAVGKMFFNQLVPLVFALMLNEVRNKYVKKSVQTLVYMPHFFSWVIVGGIFIDLLSSSGIVNQFLGLFGIASKFFLGSNDYFQGTMIITEVWKEFGWNSILYLAAISGVNPELYEAACLDGAGRFRRIWNVTLPCIKGTIILLVVLNLSNILNAGFDQIFNLYNPAVYRTGDIIDTFVYRMGLEQAQFSLSTAVGLFKSVIGLVLIVISRWVAYKTLDYRIF